MLKSGDLANNIRNLLEIIPAFSSNIWISIYFQFWFFDSLITKVVSFKSFKDGGKSVRLFRFKLSSFNWDRLLMSSGITVIWFYGISKRNAEYKCLESKHVCKKNLTLQFERIKRVKQLSFQRLSISFTRHVFSPPFFPWTLCSNAIPISFSYDK